jgi:hypothetical protein
MFDPALNPYQAPKSTLGATISAKKYSKFFYSAYIIVVDLTILYFLAIDIWLGIKAMPTYRRFYNEAGLQLSWLVKIGLHPFISKALPLILFGFAIFFNFRIINSKYSKIYLLIIALIGFGIYRLLIYSAFQPLSS